MNCGTLIGIIVLLIHLGLSGCGTTANKSMVIKAEHSCNFQIGSGEATQTGNMDRTWSVDMGDCVIKETSNEDLD